MSAESPRRVSRYNGATVRPQSFSDRSVIESVVDIIYDVVPQVYSSSQKADDKDKVIWVKFDKCDVNGTLDDSRRKAPSVAGSTGDTSATLGGVTEPLPGPQIQVYSSSQKADDKDKVIWVKFDKCDVNDLVMNPDLNGSDSNLPLLLIMGYSNGVQVWVVNANGEAQEALSMRQGPVRCLRVLPTPDPRKVDKFKNKRPLVAVCDTASAGPPYCSVKFLSLRSGDEIHNLSFKTNPVVNIECNKRFVVVMFQEQLSVLSASKLQQLFWVTSCYPCPGVSVNPIALGTRWLAYADKRLVSVHQSCGGMSGDGGQSYAATVISAAKSLTKGMTMFGEAIVSSVTGAKTGPVKKAELGHQLDNSYRPGIVTIIDMQAVNGDVMNVHEEMEGEGLIAHFHAHANEPVAAMAFDPSGTLLLTACKLGHNFHLFRIVAHPCSSSLGAIHHLYTLHRGDTTAKVVDINFNIDSRWVAVSTHRGTTHVFPITPYGGSVSVRTHCSSRVVNRASRFHKSAGLEELEHSSHGRHSPLLSGSPGTGGSQEQYPSLIRQNALNNNMGNPRLPPYPHPTNVYPLAQIKQCLNLPGIGPTVSGGINKTQSPTHTAGKTDNVLHTASIFAASRAWVVGSPNLSLERREGKRPVDSLFVVGPFGPLVEYVLEPRHRSGTDKISDDTPLDLAVTGRIQWNLLRATSASEQRPPLMHNNPLVLATEAVVSQQPTMYLDATEPGLVTRHDSKDSLSSDQSSKEDADEQWLSQVEIITHAGPNRRLWMGPQFSFKTYQNTQNTTVLHAASPALLSQSPESHLSTMDIVSDECDLESLKMQPTRSSPVAMPLARPAYRRSSGGEGHPSPGRGQTDHLRLIEAGSFDQSPNLSDVVGCWAESTLSRQPRGSEEDDDRLRETLAEAMIESPTKECRPPCGTQDVFHGSSDNLSTSSGSSSSATRGIMFGQRSMSPARASEHTLLFPNVNSSPDST